MAASFADLPTQALWPSHMARMVDKLPMQQLSQLHRVCRSLNQACNKLFQQRSREIQEIFVEIASHLRWMLTGLLEQLQEDEAENKAQEVWELMFWVRDQAKGILELLEVTRDNYLGTEVVDGGILQIYIACKTEQSWKPSEISDSAETFMWKLRVPSPMPLDKWRISWTITEDTGGAGPEDSALPESMPGGADLAELQELEHELLEARARQPGDSQELALILARLGQAKMRQGHHAEAIEHLKESLQLQRSLDSSTELPWVLSKFIFCCIPLALLSQRRSAFPSLNAATLHQLGQAKAQTGDLKEALRYLKESLRMKRSLHGDGDHPGVAATLHELGDVTAQTGDLKEALHYLKESLRMKRSLHGDGDHPDIAVILHEIGRVTAQTGDLKEALRYLKESLRMQRSLHGDGDHPGIAATLHELGRVTAQTGDLKEALRYLKESLRMTRSLHGDGDHPGIAVTLHELGRVTAQTGDLKEALRYLKESLRMTRSLHGDGDHPGVAATLHELGDVTAQTGDMKEALRYLKESLRMQWSLHGDGDHPGIAATLAELGRVTAQTGDLKEALRYLKESLRMKRSLHGDGDHPEVAAILHELGHVTAQTGDLKEVLRYLKEFLRMKRSLHGDGDHPGVAATLHDLGDVTAQTGDMKEEFQPLCMSLARVMAEAGELKEAQKYRLELERMLFSLRAKDRQFQFQAQIVHGIDQSKLAKLLGGWAKASFGVCEILRVEVNSEEKVDIRDVTSEAAPMRFTFVAAARSASCQCLDCHWCRVGGGCSWFGKLVAINGGTVDTCPDLSIESGSGESIVVSAPYQRDVVQHLYSMAEQSQVGTLERTVIDTSARRSKEFSQVKVTDADRPWPLEQVCEEIRAKLAPGATRVHADLYKLLLYNKGDFFNMHKDAQQHSHMFASLLFFLPFEHEGGGLQLSRLQTSWEKSAMFDVANINKDGCCSWVAFYTDVCHKVLDVKSGHRLVLNYTLRFEGSMSPSPCLPKLPTRAIDLVKQTLKGNADLAIPLFYAYTAESFGTSFLKGRDAYLFNALHACGLAASVRFVLCIDTTSVWYYDDCPEEPDWHTSFDRAVLVGEEFVREAVQLEEERHQSRGFDNDGRQLIAKGEGDPCDWRGACHVKRKYGAAAMGRLAAAAAEVGPGCDRPQLVTPMRRPDHRRGILCDVLTDDWRGGRTRRAREDSAVGGRLGTKDGSKDGSTGEKAASAARRSLHQACDQQLWKRFQQIRKAFHDIDIRVQAVLEQLPEDLQEEVEEDSIDKAMELWDFMKEVRDMAKGILKLLEVTQHQLLGAEVTNEDLLAILAEIVVRAEHEAVRDEAILDTRKLHIEAACLRSSSIVLHPPMNPPFETESVYSVTDQTQSGTRPSQPRQFPGTITEDSGGPGAGPEDVPESMPGGADLAELQKLEHRLLEATAWQTGDSTELAVILHNLGQVNGCQGHHAEAMEYLRESLQMKRFF
ncbi:unnamed protein product [Durusdinium trenchii]|uniref:Fe2OG dioxygenase domain-containing protein n=1 Tax=Durusdinium trenchii TaxID=1381693 RepID=A0ABP0Q5X7_9DINO